MANAAQTNRKAPPFTFFDGACGAYRPQFTRRDGGRWHRYLRKADGELVRDERDVRSAMIKYLRGLVDAGEIDGRCRAALYYLGADMRAGGAEIIPISLPPRAPPPSADRARAKQAPVLGWHGMEQMRLEVDHRLIAELAPDGTAAKIMVSPGTPAARAGLHTGDYVLSAGRYGAGVPLADFEALSLPAGVEIFVQFHRPGRHKVGQVEVALLKLRRRPGLSKPRWWQLMPRVAHGLEVQRDERSVFEAEMAKHPRMNPLGFRILVRLLRHYDGRHGAFPSYSTIAGDVGCQRRASIENVQHLERLGIVEILVGAGRVGRGGVTNRFVMHWPEAWPRRVAPKSGAP